MVDRRSGGLAVQVELIGYVRLLRMVMGKWSALRGTPAGTGACWGGRVALTQALSSATYDMVAATREIEWSARPSYAPRACCAA